MVEHTSEIQKNVAQQAGLKDEDLPVAPDPNLKFWKDTARGLLGESIKSIEETAKQIIGVAGILEVLYFHAIAYSDIRGTVNGIWVLLYVLPLLLWLISLGCALSVFFPNTYDSNISSWRESKATFERIVAQKHGRLKAAGISLALGTLVLCFVMIVYLTG